MTLSTRRPQPSTDLPGAVTRWAIGLCFGLIPLLMVPGIDEFTLLPRLLFLQAALFAVAVARTTRNPVLRSSPLTLPATGFILILAASAFWAINPYRAVYDLSKHLTFFLFFYLLTQTLNRSHILPILRAGAVAGALVSLLGIGEYLGLLPLWLPSTGRPSSTFGFRNLAAAYLIASIPLSGLLFLIPERPRDRLLGTIPVALMLTFLLYTRTRGAWVGLAGATGAGLILWAVFARHSLLESARTLFNRPTLKFGILFLLVAAVLSPLPQGFRESHVQRFDEKKADLSSAITSIVKTGGDRGRLRMWQNTLGMIRDAPVLGVGLGNWEYAYPLYDSGQMLGPNHNPLRPHNDLLWIWAEQGTLGLLAYLTLLGVFLLLSVRIWRRDASPRNRILVFACVVAALSVTGDGFFSFPRERIPPSMILWFAFAVVGILSRNITPRTPARPAPRPQTALILLLLFLSAWITLCRIGFDYHYIRAMIAFQRQDKTTMTREAESALAFGPFNHQAFIIHADGLIAARAPDRAEQTLRRALRYHPNFANTYNNLGLAHFEQGRIDSAKVAYRKAMDLIPGHYAAQHNTGNLFEKKGQIDSAKVYYRRAFRPNHTKPYVNLGAIYRKQGLPDSAIAVYQKVLSASDPAIEAYFNLANVYAERREYEKAEEAYAGFISRWTGDPQYLKAAREGLSEAYSGQGVQSENRGDFDRAFDFYLKALEHWPDNARNWYNLANVYRQQKNLDEAVRAYKKSIALDPADPNAHNNLGMTYRDLGQYDNAVEAYRKALQLQPDQSIIHYNMGNAYADMGETAKAREAYDAFLRLWQGDRATPHYYLGNAYAEMGDTSGALEAYGTFLKHWTGDPAVAGEIRSRVNALKNTPPTQP